MENFVMGFFSGIMSVTVGAFVFTVIDYIKSRRL